MRRRGPSTQTDRRGAPTGGERNRMERAATRPKFAPKASSRAPLRRRPIQAKRARRDARAKLDMGRRGGGNRDRGLTVNATGARTAPAIDRTIPSGGMVAAATRRQPRRNPSSGRPIRIRPSPSCSRSRPAWKKRPNRTVRASLARAASFGEDALRQAVCATFRRPRQSRRPCAAAPSAPAGTGSPPRGCRPATRREACPCSTCRGASKARGCRRPSPSRGR